ncbi:MAG TPA: class I SAM-dependent methyltransferase [Longimicrobiaceae bacterium]|nr:class I SAM-dependent methyltransferase [Longimicrobiaceae bacterium]
MPITRQPENPDIRLVETPDEVTLLIDGEQAMQGWERDLMFQSADLLCGYGSHFLEVGLGLGLSALRIAGNPTTRRHLVLEKYQKVIDLFRERHPVLPPSLELRQVDFFEHVHRLEPESFDGIFFDPHVPAHIREDEALWNETVPLLARALRVGGALVPCFSSYPVLRWQFVRHFGRVVVERHSFTPYANTNYMASPGGDAYIQCFIRTE